MKRTYLLLTLLTFTFLLSIGRDVKHISIDFNLIDFEIQQNENGDYFVFSSKYGSFFKSDTLLPALPYIGYNVLISKEESYSSHNYHGLRHYVRSKIQMAHNPEAIPTNMVMEEKEKRADTSFLQKKYPKTTVELVGTNDIGEYRLLTFHVCPFEYDAEAKRLYFIPHIDIDISLIRSYQNSKDTKYQSHSDLIRKCIKKIVVNPEDIANSPDSIITDGILNRQTGYEYVIVTSDQYKSIFQRLANWKSRKGIRSKVLTVEDICSSYSGSTKAEKIKRALADINNLSYVLLGGDTLNIPTCMCYIGEYANTSNITPADYYYSCLGNIDWDNNGNALYGELEDNVSLIPSFNVSRAPIATADDALVFVNRIIHYESAPDTTNWKDDILMCGTSLGRTTNNTWSPVFLNGQSDTQIWSQMTYNQYIAPHDEGLPSWDGTLTRYYDTYTDTSGDGSYDFSSAGLQQELSKGYTFVDIMTHGGYYSWTMETGPSYTWYSANALSCAKPTIIMTTACNTNAFDYNRIYHNHGLWCLSQHFIQNPHSNILAYWGTSRENFYASWSLTALNYGLEYNALTYRKLFEDKYHRLGTAVKELKSEKASSAQGSYSPYRKIWMSLNLMGDPEMPVFLSKPKTFQHVSIQCVNDSIYVDAGTEGFDVCFINQSDSTDYYIARCIDDSIAVFSRLDGIFDVCITKPGYIPFFTKCGESTYLQNQTIEGTRLYTAKNIIAGSEVTEKVSQGPVIINNGSTTFKVTKSATITKDFEVKVGAEFTVTNQ